MGFEGANVIFDTWVHPLVMGLEEHLLHMFRDDFEFHDDAGASHHGHKAVDRKAEDRPGLDPGPPDHPAEEPQPANDNSSITWLDDAEKELKKIPFFVRGKARRNTETFAAERGMTQISLDTLYEAKAHYAR
jgi:light-independent protochlorophyllide reductase subunit B